MPSPQSPPAVPRRADVTAVHSLCHFAFTVPDIEVAAKFYADFGLDVRHHDDRLELYTFGNLHHWGSLRQAPGPKKFQYATFGAYEDDLEALERHLDRAHIARAAAHPDSDGRGIWVKDPDANLIQIVAAPKVSASVPDARAPGPPRDPHRGAAPMRAQAGRTYPRRLSHVLLFSSDVLRSVRFYEAALGLRLSDRSGEIIAFMHGAHASDHHILAFAKSAGPGLHHSSWDVGSVDEIGLGMQYMADRGYAQGWGVGRHVIGSNYFCYVRDPWGSFAEYSHDIDFIGADVEWKVGDYPPEDSLYVWGPPPPDYFIVNHEVA